MDSYWTFFLAGLGLVGLAISLYAIASSALTRVDPLDPDQSKGS